MKLKNSTLFAKFSKIIVAFALPAVLILQPLSVKAFEVIDGDDEPVIDDSVGDTGGGGFDVLDPTTDDTTPTVIEPTTTPSTTPSTTKPNPGTGDMTSIIIVATIAVGGSIVLASKKLKEQSIN